MPITTWDPLSSDPTVGLSTDMLTATITPSSDSKTVAATRTLVAPTYYEMVPLAISGTEDRVGLLNRAFNYFGSQILGDDAFHSFGWQQDGSIVVNGAIVHTISGFVANDILRICVDPTAKLIWMANGTGFWNNDVTADPVARAGGISYNTLVTTTAGAVLPAVGANPISLQSVWKAFFSSNTWTYGLPTGFRSIDLPMAVDGTAKSGPSVGSAPRGAAFTATSISTESQNDVILLCVTANGPDPGLSLSGTTSVGLAFHKAVAYTGLDPGRGSIPWYATTEIWWADGGTWGTYSVQPNMNMGFANGTYVLIAIAGPDDPGKPIDLKSLVETAGNRLTYDTTYTNEFAVVAGASSFHSDPSISPGPSGWTGINDGEDTNFGVFFSAIAAWGEPLSSKQSGTVVQTGPSLSTLDMTVLVAIVGSPIPYVGKLLRDTLPKHEEIPHRHPERRFTPPIPLTFPIYPHLFPQPAFSIVRRAIWSTRQDIAPTSGRSKRVTFGLWPIWEWELTYERLADFAPGVTNSDFETLLGFFLMMQGGWQWFAYLDETFNQTVGQLQMVGDGSRRSFPLLYEAGIGSHAIAEPIGRLNPLKPLKIYLNGSLVPPSFYDLDLSQPHNQVVALHAAPGAGVQVTADMHFYYAARFKDDQLEWEEFAHKFWLQKKITLQSVLG